MALLHHDATAGSPCARDNGPIKTCWYLPHNDGTANAYDRWNEALRVAMAGPNALLVEAGNWASDGPIQADKPYGFQLEGQSQIACQISPAFDDGDASVLTFTSAGASAIRRVLITGAERTVGNVISIVAPLVNGQPAGSDRVTLEDVICVGNQAINAPLWLQGVVNVDLRRTVVFCLIPHQPVPTLWAQDVQGLILDRSEVNSYAPDAPVMRLENVQALETYGRTIFGANVSRATPGLDTPLRNTAYIETFGDLSLASFRSSLFQADAGYPAENWLVQQGGGWTTVVADEATRVQTHGELYGGSGARDRIFFRGEQVYGL
jgi:hypothetical protein